jgi:3-hydroxyacyl-CoA dehydrogenase / enoyl-CoA hydratase / 3-hydroxybutyryl-CoA epimerase
MSTTDNSQGIGKGSDHSGGKPILSLETTSEGVAVITYDVPGEKVNTLRSDTMPEFARLCDEIENTPAIVAAVLISGKPASFIVGADIDMLGGLGSAKEATEMIERGHAVVDQLARSSKPVVAAIHGAALGGGCEVALACRARVLSDSSETMLGLPEVKLGLLPGLNGLQRLAALAGLQVALDHALTGKNLRPRKALKLGLADEVVARPILKQAAIELALRLARGEGAPKKKRFALDGATLQTLALEKNPLGRAVLFKQARAEVQKSTFGHYPAALRIIEVLETYARDGFEASRRLEAQAFGELLTGDVSPRLIELYRFTNELKKDSGVDDPAVKPREVGRIGVLGAGLMGAGVATVSIDAGIGVRLKDVDGAALGRGLKTVTGVLDERVQKRRLSRIERDQKLGLLSTTTDYSGLREVPLVIEAVFEDLALKQSVLRDVEAHAKEGVIFASNTSSIPIRRIAQASKHPENVVGMHYFSPVHKMPLLEVVRTAETSPEVVATAVALGKRQGKTVIVVRDSVGFYTSRILGPYMNEAAWMLTEGVAIDAIDRALRAWGWPVGPITLLDEVGIDIAAHVGPIMIEAFGDRLAPPPTMAKLVENDRKGRKNGRGFYLYGAAAKRKGKGKHVDPSVYLDLGLPVPARRAKPPIPVEEIQERASLAFVNEAMHCWGESLLRTPRDGDIGAIFGLGFPPFRGGPFRYVDTTGAEKVLKQIEGYAERLGKRWTPAPALCEMAKSGKRFYG